MENNKKTVCAIICEYNPMHTGHKFLIEEAKKKTNSTYMLGLMSGNFSQRSEPCILDKYTRSEIAIKNGMDAVINLPTAFCVNNAEIFALASIKILNNIKVDYLAFGMETINETALFCLANFLLNEPKKFKKELKLELQKGLSYNIALIYAIKKNINYFDKNIQKDILDILTLPNNILGLEYVKALIKTKSKIKPIFIKRVNNYNNNNIIENFASASHIREKIFENNIQNVKDFLPENSIKYFENISLNLELYNNLILYKIKNSNQKYLKQIYSINEGLDNKLINESKINFDYETFYQKLKTKRYKQNKINAILLNSLLDIDKKTIKKLYTIKNNICVKMLAINKSKSDIFKQINTK